MNSTPSSRTKRRTPPRRTRRHVPSSGRATARRRFSARRAVRATSPRCAWPQPGSSAASAPSWRATCWRRATPPASEATGRLCTPPPTPSPARRRGAATLPPPRAPPCTRWWFPRTRSRGSPRGTRLRPPSCAAAASRRKATRSGSPRWTRRCWTSSRAPSFAPSRTCGTWPRRRRVPPSALRARKKIRKSVSRAMSRRPHTSLPPPPPRRSRTTARARTPWRWRCFPRGRAARGTLCARARWTQPGAT